MLIAECERIKTKLNWQPRYDDLDIIASSALHWEQRLMRQPAD